MRANLPRRVLIASLSAAAVGCLPDIDRFSVADPDGGGLDAAAKDATPGDDAALGGGGDSGTDARIPADGGGDGDAAAADAGPDPDRWEDAPMRGGCPMPQLLVGIQVDDDGLGRRGKVARFALYPELERCDDLEGEGRIPFRPDALGWQAPTGVLAGSDRGVLHVDIDDDAVTWEHELDPFSASSTFPEDLFPIVMPGGETQVAGSFAFAGRSELAFLRIYDDEGTEVREWDVRTASWPTDGRTYAMGARPRRTARLLSVTDESIAAEVDPFMGAEHDPLAPAPPDAAARRVRSYDDGLFVRTTWVAHHDGEDAVYFLDNDGGRASDPPFGPLRCRGRGEEAHPCDKPEALRDAVADPTRRGRFFAICQGKGGFTSRHVVRFDNRGGSCDVVLNDGELEGIEIAVTRLAIAVPE